MRFSPDAAEPGFEQNIRALMRNSPWWLTSAVVHAVVLLVFMNIPVSIPDAEPETHVEAELPKDIEEPDPDEEPVIEPEDPDTVPVETPVEDPDNRPAENDTDNRKLHETAGEEGDANAPFTGAFDASAISIGGRSGGGRGGGGGTRKGRGPRGGLPTEIAVEAGLKWLADHQDIKSDGRWDSDGFMKHDPAHDKCDGPGHALYDVGVTGLSLLAFLGANYTDRGTHRFARHVSAGLRYLMRSQDDDGCFGTRAADHFMYNHSIASLAMIEAYWMTRNPRYKKPAQDAINFIVRSRNPYLAWRYEPRGGENDTSVTGWMIMALKAGRWAGLEIDPNAFAGARLWIDKMTDPEFGQVGYTEPGGSVGRPEGLQDSFPPEKSQAMTSVGMLSRIFLGEDPATSDLIRKGADLCLEVVPKWDETDGSIDMYYWYYGTLAMFQVGGRHWKRWNKAMTRAIVPTQQSTGAKKGSWDPVGVWGSDGGRVYATATMVLCLEVYYRYDKVMAAFR